MTTQRSLSTPTAILISGAMLAVAVFFGLRSRAPDDGPRPAASPAVSVGQGSTDRAPPAAQEVASDRAPPPSAPPSAPSDAVVAQVTSALEAQRKDLIEGCWKPAAAKQPSPPSMKLHLNFSFDAGGAQIIRGVREERETARPEVRQCVSDSLKPIRIPPPGTGVFVEVPFALP